MKKPQVRDYHGGGEKGVAAPWLYALHDVVKRRDRTLKLLPLVWPAHIGIPEDRILIGWMKEVESGEVKIDQKKRQWVKDSLELDEQQSIREAVLETSRTLTHFAKRLREDDKPPPGGVIALKYLADAAGFLAGKRSETSKASGTGQSVQTTKFMVNFGQRPQPKIRTRVIDAEAKELTDGS